MPQLHSHVIASEILAESFYAAASIQNTLQGKQMGKVVWWGVPWPGTVNTGILFPALLLWYFSFAVCKWPKTWIRLECCSFQMAAWRLQLWLSFLLIPIRRTQRNFVALTKIIWMRQKQNWRKWLALWMTSLLKRQNSRVRMVRAQPGRVLFPSNLPGVPQHCIGELYCATASALMMAGLGLMNGAVASCLLKLISSMFLSPWWGDLALDWLLKQTCNCIYQHTVIPSPELKWMYWLGTQFAEQGHVHLFCNIRGKAKESAYCFCLYGYHLPQCDLGHCTLEDAYIRPKMAHIL